ncbi:hypothetical protein FB451DRAFT_1450356 [Mycena latifolia]|nr:hypothetical protein FB451DRAFT_1450356 [Mycena latifolia]
MSSPFTSKLGTNYCPRDEEIAEIKALFIEPTLRLEDLDHRIADLQNALDKLVDEHTRISTYVEAHKALISPARRLPLDILEEIFVACLPTHRNCVMSAVEAPVLLGRVCGSWRSISLLTPRLWSRVHVVEPTFKPQHTQALFKEKLAQRLEITKTWLGRSGQCLLSISLQCPSPGSIMLSLTGSSAQILRALFPFSSRWEHIAFVIHPSILATMSDLTEADVPMLKSVELNVALETFRWSSLGFLQAPRICSVSIRTQSLTPSELPLRWDCLTNLSVVQVLQRDFITNAAALQVFSLCPQLRTCGLAVRGAPGTGSGAAGLIVELPFLYSLELRCLGTFSAIISQLFDQLSLPQLRDLTLDAAFEHVSETVSYGPLLTAAPHLKGLTLVIKKLPSRTSLADFLRILPPTLCCLEIRSLCKGVGIGDSSTLDDKILESLIPIPGFPVPCPGLQVMNVTYPSSVSDATLLRFITARTLKHVAITFQRAMTCDIHAELQSSVQSGLQLELTYSPHAASFSPWEGLEDKPTRAPW